MNSPVNRSKGRKNSLIAFGIALLGVPALLLWMNVSSDDGGSPTFESLNRTQSEEKSPLEAMEDMWEHHPGHGPIALELANLYLENGQYQKAIEFYNFFLSNDTSATGWLVRLDMSRAYSAMMMKDSAVAQLKVMLARDAYHPGALYNLGAIEANAGNFDAAREHWQTLIAKHPQDTLAKFAQSALPKLNKPAGHP